MSTILHTWHPDTESSTMHGGERQDDSEKTEPHRTCLILGSIMSYYPFAHATENVYVFRTLEPATFALTSIIAFGRLSVACSGR